MTGGTPFTGSTPMTDEQFASTSRIVATALLTLARNQTSDADQAANMTACACAEAIAQLLDPVAAVERLRDVADRLEAQLLSN